MAGEANIWNPRTLIAVSADTKSVEEKLIATAAQTLFTITDFIYVVGTGALEVHKNGLLLTKGTDWVEQTGTTFAVISPSTAGDVLVASGHVGITGLVDVRDTDIFISNYQAIRDYTGTEVTLYSQGQVTTADGGESFFQKKTGAAPGTYVDDNSGTIVPTGGNGSVGWLAKKSAVLDYDTLALAAASLLLRVGDSVNIKERTSGLKGSGAIWDVVLTSAVTPNTADIVVSTGNATLSLVYRPEATVKISQIGGNITSTSAATMTALATYPHVMIDTDITKAGTYAIPAGQIFELAADIIQSDNLTCFNTVASSWQLIGNGEVRRSAGLPTALIAGSVGISVSSTCFLYRMTGNITFKHFSDIGIKMDGGGLIVGSVGRNTVSGITCTRNWDGMQLLDGFPAEYTSFSDCFLTDNVAKGLLLETGNINWVGGTITGNLGGIHLRHPAGGGNPHHGMFLGANINHNTDYAIWAEQVANGQDFVGCHFYNNANPATGRIKLEDCRGINITGGTIGTNIEYINTGHIHVGYNRIAGNKMELANSGIEPTAGTFDRSKLLVEDNFSLAGRWDENDVANMEFLRWQGAATQVLTGATEFNLTALVGAVTSDNRNIFDGTNVTVPYLVDLTIHVGLNLAATAAIVGGETLLIERDPLGTGVWQVLRNINMQPLANAAGTRFSIDVTVPFQFTSGAKFRARLIGMTAGTSYTIAEGGYVSCTTAR